MIYASSFLFRMTSSTADKQPVRKRLAPKTRFFRIIFTSNIDPHHFGFLATLDLSPCTSSCQLN